MEQAARLVLVNLLESDPGETALHHPLPVPALLAHVARRRLLRCRVHPRPLALRCAYGVR